MRWTRARTKFELFRAATRARSVNSRVSRARRVTSERPVAFDRHPFHHTAARVIVGRRIVLSGAVVPERDGSGLPTQPNLPFGMHRLLAEPVEEPLALVVVEPDDAFGEEGVHEQRLATGLGMRPDDRMLHRGVLLEHLGLALV